MSNASKLNINKVLLAKCNKEKDFFDCWVGYLNFNLGLTNREQKVLSAVLRNRHELSKTITNTDVLDEVCLNVDNKNKIKDLLDMTLSQIGFVLIKLRDKKVLLPHYNLNNNRVDFYKVNPSIIPNYKEGEDFKFLILFRDVQ